jgi:3-phosphoshikimate 1-carboxyvinyltransferase
MSFRFRGQIAASKSLMNRALIVASYADQFKIVGDSQADDVQLMKSALTQLKSNVATGQSVPLECGHAGTVLRFLALRAAREKGTHRLRGSERLFSRPQSELLSLLGQLGAFVEVKGSEMIIRSDGWRLVVDGLQVNADRSSQFASSVLLNAWQLPFDLHFSISKKMVSEGYFLMTLELVRQLGLRVDGRGPEFFIAANQSVRAREYAVEPDLSSAFAVAALGVVGGEATILNFPKKSLQPDAVFLKILKDMGAQLSTVDGEVTFRRSQDLSGVQVNIENSPDLFPVLGVLCALAHSPSHISGVGHLKFKESARLERTAELLSMMGARVEQSDSEVTIWPVKERTVGGPNAIFQVDQDHRMAMAVAVAQRAGFAIQGDQMQVVSKSFPEFLQLLEGVSC